MNKEELRKYHREWYYAHQEEEKKYQREYSRQPQNRERACQRRMKAKQKVLAHYGNGKAICISCGEDRLDCLSIDHIDGNGARQRREVGRTSGSGFYYWLIRECYPEGYQTLCMNCQWIKRAKYKEHRRFVEEGVGSPFFTLHTA